VPTVCETKFFEVAPSLKSVFDDTNKPFSLFGSHTEASQQSAARDVDDDDDSDSDSDTEDTADAGETFRLLPVIICPIAIAML